MVVILLNIIHYLDAKKMQGKTLHCSALLGAVQCTARKIIHTFAGSSAAAYFYESRMQISHKTKDNINHSNFFDGCVMSEVSSAKQKPDIQSYKDLYQVLDILSM